MTVVKQAGRDKARGGEEMGNGKSGRKRVPRQVVDLVMGGGLIPDDLPLAVKLAREQVWFQHFGDRDVDVVTLPEKAEPGALTFTAFVNQVAQLCLTSPQTA